MSCLCLSGVALYGSLQLSSVSEHVIHRVLLLVSVNLCTKCRQAHVRLIVLCKTATNGEWYAQDTRQDISENGRHSTLGTILIIFPSYFHLRCHCLSLTNSVTFTFVLAESTYLVFNFFLLFIIRLELVTALLLPFSVWPSSLLYLCWH